MSNKSNTGVLLSVRRKGEEMKSLVNEGQVSILLSEILSGLRGPWAHFCMN